MNAAAQLFVGTKDFSAFRAKTCQSLTPTKTIKTFSVYKLPDVASVISNNEDIDCFEFKVCGDSFLQYQVRFF